ncbi:hypothetical protein RI367_001679 [Sorochytrium milnesiophthora]
MAASDATPDNNRNRGQLDLPSLQLMNQVNVLKDKALYRFERELNLSQFKELMKVFQEKAAQSDKAGLTIDEFRSVFAQILNSEMSEEQITMMFMRIGVRGERITWDAFSNFMLLRAQGQTKGARELMDDNEQDLFRVSSHLLLGRPMATPHKDVIVRIVHLPHADKVVTCSREGTICYWSDKIKLQRTYSNITDTASDNDMTVKSDHSSRAVKSSWISDIRYMPDMKKWAVVTDRNEVTIHDFATLDTQARFVFVDPCLCLDYTQDVDINAQQESSSGAFGARAQSTKGFGDIGSSSSSGSGSGGRRSNSIGDNSGSAGANINNDSSSSSGNGSSSSSSSSASSSGSGNLVSGASASAMGIFLVGNDQGEVLIIYVDVEGLLNTSVLGKSKRKVPLLCVDKLSRTGDDKFVTTLIKKKLHGDWLTSIKYYPEFKSFLSCSPDVNESLVLGKMLPDRKWRFTSASVNKGVNTFGVCVFPPTLVTGGADRKLRIWNPRRISNPKASLKGHAAPILAIEINQALCHAISMSADDAIKVWDMRLMQCVQSLPSAFEQGPEDTLSSLCLKVNHNGSFRLFCGSSLLMMWDMEHREVEGDAQSHDAPVRQVVYNPVCHMLASLCEDSAVCIWEAQTGARAFKFQQADVTSLSFDFDVGGRRLITAGENVTLSSIEGQALHELQKPEASVITSLAYVSAKEGKRLFAGGWRNRIYVYDDKDDRATWPIADIWSVDEKSDGAGDQKPGAPGNDVLSIVHAPPGKLVYSTFRGEIWVRNLAGGIDGCMVAPYAEQEPVWERAIEKLIFQRKGRELANLISSGSDGMVRFWNTDTLSHCWSFDATEAEGTDGAITGMALLGDAQLLTGDQHGSVYVWDVSNAFHLDGKANSVKLSCSWQAHLKAISCIEVMQGSLSQPVVVTASLDCTVRCWSATGHYIGVFGQAQPWDLTEPEGLALSAPDVARHMQLVKQAQSAAGARKVRASAKHSGQQRASAAVGPLQSAAPTSTAGGSGYTKASAKRRSGSSRKLLISARRHVSAKPRSTLKTADLLTRSYRTWYATTSFAQEKKYTHSGHSTTVSLPKLAHSTHQQRSKPTPAPKENDRIYQSLPNYELNDDSSLWEAVNGVLNGGTRKSVPLPAIGRGKGSKAPATAAGKHPIAVRRS